MQPGSRFYFRLGKRLPQLFELDALERQTLAKIVVKIPGNAGALFFLSLNEAAA